MRLAFAPKMVCSQCEFCSQCEERHSIRIVFRMSRGRSFIFHVSMHEITFAFEVKLHSHALLFQFAPPPPTFPPSSLPNRQPHTQSHIHRRWLPSHSFALALAPCNVHIYVVLLEIVWNWKMVTKPTRNFVSPVIFNVTFQRRSEAKRMDIRALMPTTAIPFKHLRPRCHFDERTNKYSPIGWWVWRAFGVQFGPGHQINERWERRRRRRGKKWRQQHNK